mmetsp:Transcript_14054/g.41241  ORF Transcript_14054/g.41241 Transcript_14054/m.41241 type:complete len:222 (+) Transcript_14054:77-742(+)
MSLGGVCSRCAPSLVSRVSVCLCHRTPRSHTTHHDPAAPRSSPAVIPVVCGRGLSHFVFILSPLAATLAVARAERNHPAPWAGSSLYVYLAGGFHIAGVCHKHGSAASSSFAASMTTSIAGSSSCGASPGLVASAAALLASSPPCLPRTSTVRIPIALAARMFFMLSSTMIASSAVAPTLSSTAAKAAGSGLQAGITSSTAKSRSSGKRSRNPSASSTRAA